MSKVYGAILIIVAVAIATLYLIGLVIAPETPIFGTTLSELLIRYTVLAFILLISVVLAYIGFMILTSPIPKPVEEIIKEYREHTK